MSLLKELKEIKSFSESSDMSELPHDVYHELEQHIQKGAKDLDKKYVNALELVREAYKVEHVELPDPSMKKAWEQFTVLLQYATANLTKFRGIDGDWRMSSHVFHEATEYANFKVIVNDGKSSKSYNVRDASLSALTESVKSTLSNEYDVSVSTDKKISTLNLSKWNIKQSKSVTIKQLS